ncbi:MAG: hypothetical protein ACFCUM_16675 [Bacteroidales bacterium]
MEKYQDIFINVCKKGLEIQDKVSGAMPAGHNGPYYDKQTPIRNTCHWAISFIKAFSITGQIIFKVAAKKCLDYVCYNNEYRIKHTFIDRYETNKDQENGTIGPAWNIEALITGYRFFNDKNYLQLATDLFYALPFDKKKGLWQRVTYQGNVYSVDKTYNHQLWFAAASFMLYKESGDAEIMNRIESFIRKDYLSVRKDGLIVHAIYKSFGAKDFIKSVIKNGLRFYKKMIFGKSMQYKEVGYHLFNLYAFSILKDEGCEFIMQSKKFKKALSLCFKESFFLSLSKSNHTKDVTDLKITNNLPFNRYGYAYNVPGFEIPFIYEVWKDHVAAEVLPEMFWIEQLKYTYNYDLTEFSLNSEDPVTLTARIYELCRYL